MALKKLFFMNLYKDYGKNQKIKLELNFLNFYKFGEKRKMNLTKIFKRISNINYSILILLF